MRGEVTLVVETDDRSRFDAGRTLHTHEGEQLVVRSSRPFRDRGMVVAFEGTADRNAAELLRGTVLFAPLEERRDLAEDEFWPEDLVGLTVMSEDGQRLGTVTGYVSGPAQDRLVISADIGMTVELPFVADLADDPRDGAIVIRPPLGMFEIDTDGEPEGSQIQEQS